MLTLSIIAGVAVILGAILMLTGYSMGGSSGVDTYIVGRVLLILGILVLLGTFVVAVATHTNA